MSNELKRIEFCGVLDAIGALDLGRAVEDAVREGALRVEVDLKGTELALADGIRILQFTFFRKWREGLSDFILTFHDIPTAVAVQFQLQEFTVHRHSLTLAFPGTEGGEADRGDPLSLTVCISCDTPVRIKGHGLYECPSCGAHFFVDQAGRTTGYEPLATIRRKGGEAADTTNSPSPGPAH